MEYPVLVIDLETSGLPLCSKFDVFQFPSHRVDYEPAHVMSYAYVLAETPADLQQSKINSALVQPATNYVVQWSGHGLTWEQCNSEGVSLDELHHVWCKCKTVVAYNVMFDYNVLAAEFMRRGYLIRPKLIGCIMQSTISVLKLERWPKLGVALELFGMDFTQYNLHQASDDLRASIELWNAQQDMARVEEAKRRVKEKGLG